MSLSHLVLAQRLTNTQKVIGSDIEYGDEFGTSVSIQGDYAIVGTTRHFHYKGEQLYIGAAYIYFNDGNTWRLQSELIGAERRSRDWFGYSVDLDGRYAIISTFYDVGGEQSGSAHVYYRSDTGWVEQAKLVALDGELDDRFGGSVSISDSFAVVGAYGNSISTSHSDRQNKAGVVYVFARLGDQWIEQTKLSDPEGKWGDRFGSTVSIHKNDLIVGAPFNDGHGSAYLFHYGANEWTRQEKFVPSQDEGINSFGYSVDIKNGQAIVGVYGTGIIPCAAYVFARHDSSWTEQIRLTPSDGGLRKRHGFVTGFGGSVGISERYAIVGARHDEHKGRATGAAYVFFRDDEGWREIIKLHGEEGGDHFGSSVAIDGINAIAGAWGNNDKGTNSGAAYLLQLSTPSPLKECVPLDEALDLQKKIVVCKSDSLLLDTKITTLPDGFG